MKNLLIISDLHLDEYDGRLDKYLELADNLVQTCKENSANEMIIAGDTINKATTNPRVLHTLDKFVDKFIKNDIKVSYLLGQHDWALANISEDMTNTYLSLFENMNYVGDSYREEEDVRIYFHNFKRGNVIDIPECDVCIAHFSIGMQEVKNPKNIGKFMLAGDIHAPIHESNLFAVSPPMQIHAAEPQQGYAMLLKLDNGNAEFERIKLPIIFKMPPLQKLKKIDSSILKKKSKVEKYVIPESVVKDFDMSNLPQPIDFNFRLRKLVIDDYKSIKHRELEFDDDRVVFLHGSNGTGKTTTLDAIYYTFVKSRQVFNRLEVEFQYKDHIWNIIRQKTPEILCDGHPIQFKNKSEFEDKLNELFPFIPMLEYFYVKTYHRFFECDRVKLFEELFNLKEYEYVCTQAKNLQKKYKSELEEAEKSQANIQGWLDAYADQVQDINIDIEKVKSDFNTQNEAKGRYLTLDGQKKFISESILQMNLALKTSRCPIDREEAKRLHEINEKRKSLEDSILRLKKNIIICPNCGEKINGGNIDELQSELDSLETPKFSIIETRSMLRSFEDEDRMMREINEKQERLNKISEELNDLVGKFNEDDILALSGTIMNYEHNEKLKANIKRGKDKLKEVSSTIASISSRLADLDELIQSVDIKVPTSIPVKRLQELVTMIETDDIKFSVLSELKNGNLKLDLQVKYRGIDYDDCSSGERCMLDLHLIQCISRSLGSVGLIMLDESLATLSEYNYELAGSLLREFETPLVLITSHQIGFSSYDKKITLER